MGREAPELERRPSIVRFPSGRLDVESHPVVIVLCDSGLRRDDNSDLGTLTS